MIKDVNELKEYLKNIKDENVSFSSYFDDKIQERPYLSRDLVINSIKNIENLEGFQKQIIKGDERYRVGIKLSNNYALVLIIKIQNIGLYIINAWKTSRKWQKSIQK